MNARPSWQTTVVSNYFANVTGTSKAPVSGYASGRGYPDVSGIAVAYETVIGGSVYSMYGTSASCPLVAAMVTLVNGLRMAAGKSTLGWINPAIYQYYSNFSIDIIHGNIKCCSTGHGCCSIGFFATHGWDPATGFGSINFTNFTKVFMQLGDNVYQPTPRPTVAPTTRSPGATAMPTVSSGFLYSYLYSASDCSSTEIMIQAVPIQKCQPMYGTSTATVLYYRKYTCGTSGAAVTYYSDAACTLVLSSSTYQINTCYAVPDSYYYATGNDIPYATKMMCSTTSTLSSLIPANGLSYYSNT